MGHVFMPKRIARKTNPNVLTASVAGWSTVITLTEDVDEGIVNAFGFKEGTAAQWGYPSGSAAISGEGILSLEKTTVQTYSTSRGGVKQYRLKDAKKGAIITFTLVEANGGTTTNGAIIGQIIY